MRSVARLLALSLLVASCAPAGAPSTTPGLSPTTGKNLESRDGAAAPLPMATSAPGVAVGEPVPNQPLRAGDVDDNSDFQAYLDYLGRHTDLGIAVDVSERHVLQVVDSSGKPLPNALVTLSLDGQTLYTAKTYANGKTLFFPKTIKQLADAQSATLTVEKDGTSTSTTLDLGKGGDQQITLATQRVEAPAKFDICFLLDTTGSMGDELQQLQSTLVEITGKIQQLEGNPSIRYSLVAYKDQGDDYVTQKVDFTSDVPSFNTQLETFSAGGGGDYPEDLNQGLDDAMHKLNWDSGDTIRLVFVVADAPPHLDYPQSRPYTDSIKRAQALGIKLFSVAASGLDALGEYVMRQLAQQTMGRFLFITYGGDQQSPGTTPHEVPRFSENNLSDLVVKMVQNELAQWNQKPIASPSPSATPSPSPTPSASPSPEASPSLEASPSPES